MEPNMEDRAPGSDGPGGPEGDFELPDHVARAVALARERKADSVTVLDLRGRSSATDYFVLGTGRSDIQVRSVAEHIIDELKKGDLRPSHVEGLEQGRWVLIDYIDLVVHILHPEIRDYYGLEGLWGDAPRRTFDG